MSHKVLLVDDEREFLDMAGDLLRRDPNIAIVGHAESGEEALTLLATLKPEVVIIDVNMPGMGGFEVAGRLLEIAPSTRLIIVSTSDDPEYESTARSVGAVAFLTKKSLSASAVLAALADV